MPRADGTDGYLDRSWARAAAWHTEQLGDAPLVVPCWWSLVRIEAVYTLFQRSSSQENFARTGHAHFHELDVVTHLSARSLDRLW